MAAINFILSCGCTEVFEMVCVVVVGPSFAVEVDPCLKTVSDESEISAEAVPLRDALELDASPVILLALF